jgi:protein-tyrosine phosphatase
LVEDSFLKRYQNIESYIFKIRTAGYTPILAHPERYLYLADDLDRLRKLKKMGCLFQLNLLSIQGHYGREVKHFALKLLKHKLIEFSGTDIHRIEHIKILETLKKNSKIFNRFHQYHFHNDALLSPSQQVVNSL